MPSISKQCAVSGATFLITETEQLILERLSEVIPILGRESIPLPVAHPFVALREMWGMINSRALYRGKSVLSGKPTLERWDPAMGLKIST